MAFFNHPQPWSMIKPESLLSSEMTPLPSSSRPRLEKGTQVDTKTPRPIPRDTVPTSATQGSESLQQQHHTLGEERFLQ